MTASLGVVLFNPAAGSGSRTLARVDLAAKILGYADFRIANLFPLPTVSVLEVNEIGTEIETWVSAQNGIEAALAGTSDVLLAYGCQEPTGVVRHHFRMQIAWLRTNLAESDSSLWTVSDRPRHPSRWQRHTSRYLPGMPFPEALERSLQRADTRTES